MNKLPELVIAWHGLPEYAARILSHTRERLETNFPVIYARDDTTLMRHASVLQDNLYRISANTKCQWRAINLSPPKVFIHTGWRYPAFLSLANAVRQQGGHVVGMFDNNLKINFRQGVGGLLFRLTARRKYAAAIVPGQSGAKLAKYLGFNRNDIFQGMYGADRQIFYPGKPLHCRRKQVLCVAQLIPRKSILELRDAFLALGETASDWHLTFIGEGPLAPQLLETRHPRISLRPFSSSSVVAAAMRESQIVALPSKQEHWGVAAHEAALCGCLLLVSKYVGSLGDLSGRNNSYVTQSCSAGALQKGLDNLMNRPDNAKRLGSIESCELAAAFGPERFADTVIAIMQKFHSLGTSRGQS